MNTKLLKAFEKLLQDGRYSEAEEQLRQIIKISPNDWQAQMLLETCLFFQQGEKKDLSGNTEKTVADLGKKNPKKFWRSCFYCGIAVFIVVLIVISIMAGGVSKSVNSPVSAPIPEKKALPTKKMPQTQAKERYYRKFAGATEEKLLAADRKDSEFHSGYSFPQKPENILKSDRLMFSNQILEEKIKNLLAEYQLLLGNNRITSKLIPCRHATEIRYVKQDSAPLKIKDAGRIDCYRNNGTKIAEIHFFNGFFSGSADFYSEDGKLWATVIMERGRCVRRYCYDQLAPLKFTENDMRKLEDSVRKIFDELTRLAARKKLSCKIHRVFQITENKQTQSGVSLTAEFRKNMRYVRLCYHPDGSVIQKKIITDCRNKRDFDGYFTLMNKEGLIWEDIWKNGKSVKKITYYPAVALDSGSDLYLHLCNSVKKICHPFRQKPSPAVAEKTPKTSRNRVFSTLIQKKLDLTKKMKYLVISEVAYRDPNLLRRAIPAQLGSLHAVYLQTYGVPSAGYSIRYKNNTMYADLFIYPASQAPVEELVSKEAIKLADSAPILIQRKIWTSSNIASQPLQIIKKWNFSKQIAALLEFQFSQAGKSYHSKLAVGTFLNHFVKIRFSSSVSDLHEFNRSFDDFMKHLNLAFLCGNFVEMHPISSTSTTENKKNDE